MSRSPHPARLHKIMNAREHLKSNHAPCAASLSYLEAPPARARRGSLRCRGVRLVPSAKAPTCSPDRSTCLAHIITHQHGKQKHSNTKNTPLKPHRKRNTNNRTKSATHNTPNSTPTCTHPIAQHAKGIAKRHTRKGQAGHYELIHNGHQHSSLHMAHGGAYEIRSQLIPVLIYSSSHSALLSFGCCDGCCEAG